MMPCPVDTAEMRRMAAGRITSTAMQTAFLLNAAADDLDALRATNPLLFFTLRAVVSVSRDSLPESSRDSETRSVPGEGEV